MSRVHGSKFRLVYFRIGFRIEFSPIFASLLPSSHAVSGGKEGREDPLSLTCTPVHIRWEITSSTGSHLQPGEQWTLVKVYTHTRARTNTYIHTAGVAISIKNEFIINEKRESRLQPIRWNESKVSAPFD